MSQMIQSTMKRAACDKDPETPTQINALHCVVYDGRGQW